MAVQLVWSQTECGKDASISESAQSHHLVLQKSTQLHIYIVCKSIEYMYMYVCRQ